MVKKSANGTPEINAIGAVHAALKELDSAAQLRILRYVGAMLGLENHEVSEVQSNFDNLKRNQDPTIELPTSSSNQDAWEAEGISAVALKWMKRADLDPKSLQRFFSLGIDEIDLVAKSVPGTSKRERMRNVLLLKGIAAYLSTGTPRVTYEQLKEAALHYDAYDAANFSAHIKSLSADVGGNKATGFTLTARGLTAATEILKGMLETSRKV